MVSGGTSEFGDMVTHPDWVMDTQAYPEDLTSHALSSYETVLEAKGLWQGKPASKGRLPRVLLVTG